MGNILKFGTRDGSFAIRRPHPDLRVVTPAVLVGAFAADFLAIKIENAFCFDERLLAGTEDLLTLPLLPDFPFLGGDAASIITVKAFLCVRPTSGDADADAVSRLFGVDRISPLGDFLMSACCIPFAHFRK